MQSLTLNLLLIREIYRGARTGKPGACFLWSACRRGFPASRKERSRATVDSRWRAKSGLVPPWFFGGAQRVVSCHRGFSVARKERSHATVSYFRLPFRFK